MNIYDIFGSLVFDDRVMHARLPGDIYRSLQKTIDNGDDLDLEVANVVANAMKDWALEHGVTHYTHWFQPMTGITAEKHDSFLSPCGKGQIIMEFSGKELIRGEPDASSFPSGGLRATFEARGYTAWDPTSYAFIKNGVLCIPTAFCSYTGEVLDKKTPLLRSMEELNHQTLRVLKFFPGFEQVTHVTTNVGAEQEYFLIDKEDFAKRRDLIVAGRTLFGAPATKGQELDDHYFGSIRPRVNAFMEELDAELWKLGIPSKTKHNEAAPCQHELAPVYSTGNLAADHNQIMMELMKKIADKHGLACLLHEKPFDGINGSGKHNNWSLTTNTGVNLLKPGKDPQNNRQFLLFLCAVIRAVDENQDLLRISTAYAGNDCRLGAHEAPPAIVSIFLGEHLTDILTSLEDGKAYDPKKSQKMATGVHILPEFKKDSSDRNRTSPFAFTGNKFEFRMLGSSQSVSDPNTILNTAMADVLGKFADRLEASEDTEATITELLRETVHAHKRIIFNGNNYTEEWIEEAKNRGLLNLSSTPEAISHLCDEKNLRLFTTHSIFSEIEMRARTEILYENYCNIVNIEAKTMLQMAKTEILPAVIRYADVLADTLMKKKTIGMSIAQDACNTVLREVTTTTNKLYDAIHNLELLLGAVSKETATDTRAARYCDVILPAMASLRESADSLETLTAADLWPFPTYGKMLFYI